MNEEERIKYIQNQIKQDEICMLYSKMDKPFEHAEKKQCDRCGKWFKILYPVGGFTVCKDCVEKVEVELLVVCEDDDML